MKRAVPTPPARGVVDPAMCRHPRERVSVGKLPSLLNRKPYVGDFVDR